MDAGDRERAGAVVDPVAEEGVEYHEPTATYRTHFDGNDGSVVETVIAAVSAATGVHALALPPIYDVVDTDALCALVEPTGTRRFRGSVTFEFADTRVTVEGRGTVAVEPPDGDGTPTD